MPDLIEMDDCLTNLEVMATKILDEVAKVRKQFGVENIAQNEKQKESKQKTKTILLRRRKHIMKKIKAA